MCRRVDLPLCAAYDGFFFFEPIMSPSFIARCVAVAVCSLPLWAVAQATTQVTVLAQDGSGTSPTCNLVWQVADQSDKKLRLMFEVSATTKSGRALTVPMSTVPLTVPAGASTEFASGAVQGGHCKNVRLSINKVTCMPRKACQLAFGHQGLADLKTANP